MRPVRLDMDGFASFRDKTILDFTDTDYFVLVGATGAGKSTIIDAITFALYGTVPRWNDQRMITPALAPTATRGVVRLVFDADGQRYAVAREARRSGGKTSRVSMHASRLERLHDPGDLDGEGDVLAADSEVTGAVEDLLGLSYDHFTTCVALPQGEFAQFLHAKASERQDILSSLLGYQLYDQLQSRANSLARDRQARGSALEETIATYGDATEQQVSKLNSRASQLTQLQTWLSGIGLVNLADTAQAVTDTSGRLIELTAQQQVLATVQVPPDVGSLDVQLTSATVALAEAGKNYQAAAASENQAAQKVRAFRPRHELLALRQRWEELASADTDLPDLETGVDEAKTAYSKAEQATVRAEQIAEQSRAASDQAATSADRALQAVKSVSEQVAVLAGITVPADLGELTTALAALRTRRQKLQAETDAAEDAYTTASAVLQSAPSEAALSTGGQLSTTIHDALTTDLASWDERDQTASALAAADASAVTAAATLKAARTALEEARLADEAGALRVHLVAGQPCPVCEQPVITIPAGHDTSHVAAAEQKLDSAQSSSDQATKKHSDLDRKYQAATATRAETLRHIDADRTSLCTALRGVRPTDGQPQATAGPDAATLLTTLNSPITPSATRDDLTKAAAAAAQAQHLFSAAQKSRAALQQAVSAADTRRSNASAARRVYDRDSIELDGRSHAAATALQKARDTVASFGAPSADTADLTSAWESLTRWASAEHATRDAQLPALREAVSSAAKAADAAQAEHAQASRDLKQLREKQHTTATELTRLTQTRDQLVTRQQDLRAMVSAQPDREEVAGLIAELDNLEAAATTARDALSEARQAHAQAQETADAVSVLARDSRTKLGAVRDPLIQFGAPTITADALAAAWAQLDSWAKTRQNALVTDIANARDVANRAEVKFQQAVTALNDAIAQAELPLPDVGISANELRTAVIRDVATSVATARSTAEHITGRFYERERLVKQKDMATEQAQVASTLASLLRSDAFQAWLLESALSSLVADASDLLLEMSSGQFELRVRNKDIEVIDHNDADSTRPVRTLSGGETFQASLALALALSRQVSALAASGAAKLESIFLDEGFGTLDETSLDVVAATLENLAATGERMVGVITHVSSLADRIPVRFQVTRTGAKSHIERISA